MSADRRVARFDVQETRRAVAAIGVVGQIDGHDVIRRSSALEIVQRREAELEALAAAAAPAAPAAEPVALTDEQIDACIEAWFAAKDDALDESDDPCQQFRTRMRAAIAAIGAPHD
jgi:hypothetical protein